MPRWIRRKRWSCRPCPIRPAPRSARTCTSLSPQENGLLGGGTLKVTNITAHPFHDVQLWLNQQYVAKVHEVPAAVGAKTLDISLDEFIDKHSRHYPTGRFLKPELAFPVVLAEIFDPASGRRYRLLVQEE